MVAFRPTGQFSYRVLSSHRTQSGAIVCDTRGLIAALGSSEFTNLNVCMDDTRRKGVLVDLSNRFGSVMEE